ncbi:translation initiation factor IF-3 [candidate division Kazan bacterium RIFCSPLOWO2_01_FULL_48_13]|uniref:Translation initiation factor IF-3 n=1 Tax=candidate division Kazan bacterium RIFCSPLOWO2_01_FULL_48_13 TaxID=1798539 RepID=A0A1F4PPU6_UNCK3|nr:MAG: translation initiation factor IF-3 [candidate division Kazan bacterium RIFCSPLOWO2_01_FULL_48_13]
MPQQRARINHQIRVPQVLLIDENGIRVGVIPTSEALRRAFSAELDLVEVAANLRPPVCKIMDFGKYQYEQAKSLSSQRKSQKSREEKEMRLGLKINNHDLQTKAKRVDLFISKGHKVQVTVVFRGREIAHKELGHEVMERFLRALTSPYRTDKSPLLQGKRLITIITPQ